MKRLSRNGAFVATALVFLTSTAAAAPQPPINYFQPMPIVGRLSTTVWGASLVGPRDPANGLEDNGLAGGVGPQQETNFYWDGKIIKGEDGKYHLYCSHWLHSNGFGPPAGGTTGWERSIPMEAISDNVMGPYMTQGDAYTANREGNNMGHNVTALVAPTGARPYALSVGEIVPGQMFSASSANGPWTLLGLTQTNTNGHTACGDLSSNFTFTVGPNNRFWATSRTGCIMDSDQVLGPYKVETDSVLPNLENNMNGQAEDEAIWYSGGYFHIVFNYYTVQRAYHIMSKDGVTNWMSTGLAYQAAQTPANANSRWLRYTDGTVNIWHNMERVSVYQENGHVTHFTFAVTDVNKNATGVSNGGSKILVVPFNGVQFDCDNGDPASCAEIAASDGGASDSRAGDARAGGSGGAGGGGATTDASTGAGGRTVVGTGGATGGGGASGSGGATASGGTSGSGGATGTGGMTGTGGAATGGRSGSGGATDPSAGGSGSGCNCDITSASGGRAPAALLLLASLIALLLRRSRRQSAE